MTNNNNNYNEKEEPKVIIRWNSTPFKPTVYTVSELHALRKPAAPSGSGFVYFNPNNPKGQYERPASIDMLPPPKNNKRKSQLSSQQ
jgi:hypothetical protein